MMKGFEIRYRHKVRKIAFKYDMLTIHIFDNSSDSRIHIEGVDYKKCERYIWDNFSPIEIGEKIEVKLVAIENSSLPTQIIKDKNIKLPKTKLEVYRELENKLKKQRLI